MVESNAVLSVVLNINELAGGPGYGVGLPTAGRVLDQVSLPGTLCPDVGKDFSGHVKLVVTGPYLSAGDLLGVVLDYVR